MKKHPSGTIYRRPFPNTLGICRNCFNACITNWLKEPAEEVPEAK
jgi:hypothetical protein